MTDIFISYSHKDEAWKDALQDHLLVLQNHGEFAVWDDRQIKLGDDWYPAITDAIEAAKVAVLLISADFLKSDFVRSEEIPKLLKRRAEDGLRVIPLIVRPCPWQAVPWLAELQGGTKDNFPLSKFEPKSYELEETISGFVVKVNTLLQASQREEQQALTRAEQEKQKEADRIAAEAEKHRLQKEKFAADKLMRQKQEDEKREADRLAAEAEKLRLQAEAEAKRAEQKSKQAKAIEQQVQPEPQFAATPVSSSNDSHSPKKRNVIAFAVVAVLIASGFWFTTKQNAASEVEPAERQPTSTVQPEPVVTPEAKQSEAPKRLKFEPEMVTIPAGTFTMGCLESRDNVEGGCFDKEKPAHEVTLKAFQIGKYEITFDEWDACTKAGKCIEAKDQDWGRGNRPVINVSWDDIQVYIEWLNQETGKNYRLPTEAEWEYAARANSSTAFPWGNSISCKNAIYGFFSKGCETDRTKPAGSYPANAFGLHDTSGNVSEWVADCWKGSYQGASATGKLQQDCASQGNRVLRGGSWYIHGRHCRSAMRLRNVAGARDIGVGFRLSLGL